jgi:hypothetical protein
VDRYAEFEPGHAVAGRLYVMRVSRGLALDTLPNELPADGDERVQEFRRQVESRVRLLLVADRGAPAVARTLRPTVPTAVDFMDAAPEELAAIEGMAGPLAASLTVRMRTNRRGRSGRLDVRATLRRSLSTGGVLSELVFRPPRPPRVDLLVLADVSGSVSRFTSFTFTLLHAMGGAFPRLRCFAFLDGVAEVTETVRRARTPAEAARTITVDPRLVWLDGRSDYGHALTAFAGEHGSAVTGNTVLLVLGDGRNNYQSTEADVLGALRRRARAVHWLNPEPKRYWDTGDSVMAQYTPHCDSVHECRNVDALRTFLEELGG